MKSPPPVQDGSLVQVKFHYGIVVRVDLHYFDVFWGDGTRSTRWPMKSFRDNIAQGALKVIER